MILNLMAQLDAAGLPEPELEYRFDETGKRKWQFDYAWPGCRLAAEAEGGLYGRGRRCPACGRRRVAGHSSIERLMGDMEKYNEAALQGWMLVRFTPDMVESGAALTLIERAFEARRRENEELCGGGGERC